MLSIDEAIKQFKTMAKDAKGEIINCDDLEPQEKYYNSQLELYVREKEQLATWLKELKVIKKMDLSIPQHFTKEQSNWIKTYCITRNLEFYNKAVDDFVDKFIDLCDDGEFMTRLNEFPATTILEIAEELKEGVNNG